jgi:nucleotide-binding universal stress UspA family protein
LERAQAVAHEGEELKRQLGFSVDVRVARTAPVSATILDTAVATDAELIVLGTHGTTAVQSALLGSDSSAVVHHSERPVLVGPAGPARYSRPPSRFPQAIAENPQRLIRQVRGGRSGFP